MRTQFLDTKFLTIFYDQEKQLMEAICKDKSHELTDDEYQKTALTYAQAALELKPKRILVDHTHFFYTITPTMQQWINQTILPKLFEAGVEKLAVVKSPYIFAEIAVDQILTQANSQPIRHKTFKDKNKAMEWLLED